MPCPPALIRTSLSRNSRRSQTWKPHPNLMMLCMLICILTAPVYGQDYSVSVALPTRPDRSPIAKTRPTDIRSETKLVLVPVLVTDPYERPVQGLSRNNFHVFDEGVEQNISEFFSEDTPASVGIVFDASNSMRTKIDDSREAVSQFLRLSSPGDEFSLLKFSDRPQPICPFTMDTTKIENGLSQIQSGGWTSLFDALYLVINRMKHANNGTKALFVLSDGGDNNSRYTEGEIKNMVREADVRIFSVSILDHAPALERISDESGGRAYRIHKLQELPGVAERLSAEIHSHYVLGYLPKRELNDGKYHKVVVKLVPPDGSPRFQVAWRHGYYAPLR